METDSLQFEGGKAEGRQNVKGRKGIKTKATIKQNKYDHKFQRDAIVMYDDDVIFYSLDKHKRWEEIEAIKSKLREHKSKSDGEDESDSSEEDEEEEELDVAEVVEVQTHPKSEFTNMTAEHQGVNIPRHGFSGGGFYKLRKGRDYNRVKITCCPQCGRQLDERDKKGQQHNQTEQAPEEENKDKEKDKKKEEEEVQHGVKNLSLQTTKSAQPKKGRVVVQYPFEKGQYPLYRETNWNYASPCMGCWVSQGPVWMLRGRGNKSRKKTKGFKKISTRHVDMLTRD